VKYSTERKQAVLTKLCPPHNRTIREVAAEEGISEATLYNWRKQARERGELYPDAGSEAEGWTARDKFSAVLETAAMNEAERSEYCRKRGLYPEQLAAWRRACEQANDWAEQRSALQLKAERDQRSAEAVRSANASSASSARKRRSRAFTYCFRYSRTSALTEVCSRTATSRAFCSSSSSRLRVRFATSGSFRLFIVQHVSSDTLLYALRRHLLLRTRCRDFRVC